MAALTAAAVERVGDGRAEDETLRRVCCLGEADAVYDAGKVEVDVRDSDSTSEVEVEVDSDAAAAVEETTEEEDWKTEEDADGGRARRDCRALSGFTILSLPAALPDLSDNEPSCG